MSAPIRRFGAIGDIHCEDRSLEVTIEFLRERGIDRILSVGDILDGDGDPDRCCALLAEHDVVTVRGNHERWFLAGEMRDVPGWTLEVNDTSWAFLEALPATVELETIGGKLLLCHGLGENDMAELRPHYKGYSVQCALDEVRHREDVRFFLGGHTHERMVRAIGPFVFLNPGTLLPTHDPGFMLVDLEAGIAQHYDVDELGRVKLASELPVPDP